MNTMIKAIAGTYKNIMKKDGLISESELIDMILADEYIPEKYKAGERLIEFIDEIYALPKWNIFEEKRIELFEKGLTALEIAKLEGKSERYEYSIMKWFQDRGMKIKISRLSAS